MDAIVLSPKELLVLSSQMGAKSFFGIQDPFRGMTKNEIRSELPEIQLQLEKRGLATLGFDDSFTLTALCQEIIPTCVFSEQYIVLDSIISGVPQPKSLLYFRNGEIVSLHESKMGLELKKVSANDAITSVLLSGYTYCANSAKELTSAKLSQSLLAEVREMETQEGVNTLIKAGCPSSIAQALVMGLHQECGYCSLIAIDLKKPAFNDIICVITQDGNLRLSLAEEDDTWMATWVSKDGIHNEVESMIKGYCSQ